MDKIKIINGYILPVFAIVGFSQQVSAESCLAVQYSAELRTETSIITSIYADEESKICIFFANLPIEDSDFPISKAVSRLLYLKNSNINWTKDMAIDYIYKDDIHKYFEEWYFYMVKDNKNSKIYQYVKSGEGEMIDCISRYLENNVSYDVIENGYYICNVDGNGYFSYEINIGIESLKTSFSSNSEN